MSLLCLVSPLCIFRVRTHRPGTCPSASCWNSCPPFALSSWFRASPSPSSLPSLLTFANSFPCDTNVSGCPRHVYSFHFPDDTHLRITPAASCPPPLPPSLLGVAGGGGGNPVLAPCQYSKMGAVAWTFLPHSVSRVAEGGEGAVGGGCWPGVSCKVRGCGRWGHWEEGRDVTSFPPT